MISAFQKKPAVVFFDSPGGRLWTGIAIGRIIRRHGFVTAVADDAKCESACALAWIGGKERFMAHSARIGFHAARNGDTKEVSSTGNAVVGAYLYEIGITEFKAIARLTKSDSMTWLDMPTAVACHIDMKRVAFSKEKEWSWARPAFDPSSLQPDNNPSLGVSQGKP